jgi:hypothetical protein
VIFFDNTGFCLFSLVINALFTVLIISCPCWSLLYLDEALRLRILKYDWLDARASEQQSGQYEPGRRRIPIPWNELLAEEKEKTGERSWRSFLFPWKE